MLKLYSKKYDIHKFSNFLFLLSPVIPFFTLQKLNWLFHTSLLIIFILEQKNLIYSKYYKLIWFFIVPIFWSFIYSAFQGNNIYPIMQSLFYLTTPIIFVFLGMQIGTLTNKENLLKYIIYYATVTSVIFLIYGTFLIGKILLTDIASLRNVIVLGAISNVLSIVILLFEKKINVSVFKKKSNKIIILSLNFAALILSASRTYYLLFFVIMLLFLINFNKRWFLVALFSLFILVSFVSSVKTDNVLINKFQNSLNELFEPSDYVGYKEANEYYRSYETQQAFNTFKLGTNLEYILGQGLEKEIDLGQYIRLGGTYRKNIPWVHNGYLYILIRIGFLGLICYLLFFIRASFIGRKNKENKTMHLIALGLIISLLMTNYVISGFFNTEMGFAWMILGAYITYTENFKK